MNSFNDFGLLTSLTKTLKEQKLLKPTEIQTQIIPMMMGGQSVVGVAETGSGKTLAYALPLLHKIKTLENEGSPIYQEGAPRAIVMVPTRELGDQVSKVFKTLTHETRLRVRTALGGMDLAQARRNTSGLFEILLATPARLVQMIDLQLIDLNDVRMLIFDEADQMVDQGFLTDSKLVIAACPRDVQLSLFSATVSVTVQELLNDMFQQAEVFRSKGSGKVVASLITKNMMVENGKRWPIFEKLLAEKIEGGTLIFTNTREQCDVVAQEMTEKGFECAVYRGDMDKNMRRLNLKKFREGKIKLLVSTDLGGRGLDLDNIERVINFHLPKEHENYLHRVGRTARAGRKGTVINLVTERDQYLIAKLEGKKSSIAREMASNRRPMNKKADRDRGSSRSASTSKLGRDSRPARPNGPKGYESRPAATGASAKTRSSRSKEDGYSAKDRPAKSARPQETGVNPKARAEGPKPRSIGGKSRYAR